MCSAGSGMQSPSTEDRCRSLHNEPSWENEQNILHLLPVKASVNVHTNPSFTQKDPCSFNSSTCDLRASLFINRIVSNVNPDLVFKKSAYLIAIAGKKKAYVFN